jgi:histidyl-tRNA synthetase
LIGAEVPKLEVTTIYKLIKKFNFAGDVKDLDTTGYSKEAMDALEKLKLLFEALANLGISKDKVLFNLSMVRGLDYYTGVVCETFFKGDLQQYGSIASGGRYDKLVDMFVGSETKIQGVGVSIGVTRLFSILHTEKMLDTNKKGNSHICVGYRSGQQMLKAISMANTLREQGYNVDFYSGTKNIPH